MSTKWTILLVATFLLAGGCTRTTSYHVATHALGETPRIVPAPVASIYAVAWSRDGKSFKHADQEWSRILAQGDALGFEQDGAELLAVAGQERIPLAKLPHGTTHVTWHTRRRVQTSLGRGVENAVAAPLRLASQLIPKFRESRTPPRKDNEGPALDRDLFGTDAAIAARQKDDEEDARMRRQLGLPWKKPKYGYPGE